MRRERERTEEKKRKRRKTWTREGERAKEEQEEDVALEMFFGDSPGAALGLAGFPLLSHLSLPALLGRHAAVRLRGKASPAFWSCTRAHTYTRIHRHTHTRGRDPRVRNLFRNKLIPSAAPPRRGPQPMGSVCSRTWVSLRLRRRRCTSTRDLAVPLCGRCKPGCSAREGFSRGFLRRVLRLIASRLIFRVISLALNPPT